MATYYNTYKMTPAERRARAQQIVEYSKQRAQYKQWVKEKKAYDKQVEEGKRAEEERKNQNVFTRGVATIGDIGANVITGAFKGLEGVLDLGVGVVGAVGGLFDSDFQKQTKDFISRDLTGEGFANDWQDSLKYSYLNDGWLGNLTKNVASGIGQMLPSVAVTLLTAGAGAPAAVSQAASLATLGVSAAGTSTEEAFNEGADYWAGLGYGAASGLVEVGTEKMFGGATKALTGAGLLDGITKSVADTGFKRVAKDAIEEGVEEIASELANPALKSIYKGTGALKDYHDLDYWKGVGEAGLVGSLTALAYSGTVGYGLSKVKVNGQPLNYVGKDAEIHDSLEEISSLKEKANNYQADGKLDVLNEQKIADTTKKNYQNVEKTLKSVKDDVKRAKLIEKFGLDKAFNADGSMSGQLSSWLNSDGQSVENTDGSSNKVASLKKNAYSFNLRGQEKTILFELDAVSENRAKAYLEQQQKQGKNITIEQAREQVGKVKVFDGEMSDAAKENRNKFNKALNILNKESGANLSFVITESNDSFNGSIVNDKTLYIGEDQFEKGTWAETLIHEYTHLSEGSVDYVKLVDFLSSDDILVNDGNGGKIELWKKSQEAVLRKNYGIDSETIVKIQEKLKNGQALTASEQKIIDNFASEFAAHETQYLLGNEDFIDKIVARDSSFAKKLLQKVENLKQAFKRVGNKEGQKAYKQLREAEKLYLKAAAKAGNMQIQRFILAHSPDLEKEIDVSTEIKYNFKGKKAVRYINNKLDTPTLNHIRSELSKIYGDVDSAIADGVAIAKDDTIYIVDSGRENGRIDFGVRKSITINDKQLRAEFLRRTNSDAIRKGYVSDELSSILRGEYDNDWGRDMRRELGEKLPSDKGEPKNNESRISGENGNNRRLKYSLKEGIDYAVKQNGKIYQQFDGSTEIKYNKKTSLIGKNFPPYNESFSEANTLATRWAKQESIKEGWQKLISFKDNWYLVEKFSDMDNGYQIIEKIRKSDYERYERIINEAKGADYATVVNESIGFYENGDVKQGVDSDETTRRRADISLSQVAQRRSSGESSGVETRRNSEQSNRNKQIKFSLKEDTNGKQLSARQKEYFKDSKVVDQNGKLQVVYHGTEGDFYVYDKSLRGESTGAKDAKLGFFFTNSKMVALSYAINAYDNKMFTLKHKIANGDRNILEKLTYKNGYQDLAMTDDVKEFARLQDKGERLDHDIQELYLNIKNPLETDWKGKVYKNEAMLKIIKRALLLGNDGVIIRNIEDSFDNNFGISDVFVAFEPNQIKLTTNVNPTINEDIRFSLKESNYAERNPSTVTEKEFNHHYWAIASNLLSKKEIGTLNSSVAKLKNGEFFNKNADGFYLIPVGENGIYNKIVLTDGKFNSYSIDTVIEIQLDNETDLDNARRLIYEQAKYDISTENSELFKVYYSKDFKFSDFTEKLQNNRKNSGVEQNGTRSNGEIKFSLKEDGLSKKYRYELSDGQIKKLLADKTKPKVYSKVETEETINMIVNEMLGIGEKFGSLTGKAKAEAVEMFWRGLNTAEKGKQMKVALDVAEYIIQNSALETLTDEGENYVYLDTINALKPYLHSIDLSALKGEIKYKFDTDNSAYLLWGKRKGERGLTADQVKTELAECGFIVKGDTEADIFFNMDSAYREATKALKKQTKEMLSSALSNEERKTLKNTIAKEVLLAFDKNGNPSTFSKILDQYHKEALTWKEKYYEAEKRNSEINKLLDSVQKIKNLKKGTFINASEYRTDIFKKSIDTLANIKFRGDLNKSGTRDIAAGLIKWYTKENSILGYVNEKETGYYVPEVAEMLADVATGNGKLITQEIRNLKNVVDHLTHVAESYNKVWRNGKYVEAQPIAKEYVSKMKNSQRTQVGWLKKYFEKYLTAFADPMTVARYFDKYSNGFYSEMMVALRDAATDAQIDEMNIREPIEDFIKRNKKYFAEAKKKKVNYNGHDIPLLTAMYVYMALNDTGIIPTLAKSGFVFYDGDFKGRIDGFAQNEDIEFTAMKEQAKVVQSSLEKQFTAADKEYIQIVRKIFNEDCRQRYIDTSLRIKGYYNLKEGDYIPIRRANIAINVDTSAYEFEANRVSNASFTKERAKGAIGEIRADGLNDVVDRHIRAVSQYAKIAPAIEEYNKLLNLNTVENNNKPVSVSTESHNVWAQGVEYFKKLISDIQGIPASKDSSVVVSRLRSSYAKFQLGANPKVWVTQLSSFFASGSILDFSSVIKGLTINANDVDTYCELAKLRNNENVAAMAQGVLDKVDKFGNALMKPIGVVDRFVIKRLFGACQVQIEKSIGLKIGTQENKVKAGELLKRVILETQQNSMATERSAAMRSGSEFNKTITMFSADSMKVIGRVVDSIGEYTTLNAKLKNLTDANEITAVQKKIAESGKKVAKSVTSLITSAVFMALVAQLFRTLYNKNDEDDNVVADVTTDAIGNLLGGLPYIKEIYGRFVDGYEIDGYAYSAINDMLDSTYNVFKLSGDIVTGNVTTQDVAKNIKNSVFAAGQLFGLPTRNVYNIAYGLTKRISPTAAYKVDTAFYNKGYSSDLKKAIDNDDDDMIATIVELMTNERVGNIGDSNVSKELNSLVTKGFDVIPRSVGKTITYDGEEKTLTNNQRAQFKQVYSIANKAVASLIKLSQYEKATDEVKAKAIKYIYNVYYNLALEDLLGVDLETKTVLFAEAIDVEKLAIIIAMANSLTADTDKQGKAISGTKKKKIQAYVNSLRLSAAQKYMIMGYLGFKNLNGEDTVKAYINRLKLTKSEKEKLLKYSGYGQ